MRIKVSNFTIKYNLRAAHFGDLSSSRCSRNTDADKQTLLAQTYPHSDVTTWHTLWVVTTTITNNRLSLVTLLSPDVVEAVAVVVVVVGVRLRSPGRAASN